jgi:hypothetical protein
MAVRKKSSAAANEQVCSVDNGLPMGNPPPLTEVFAEEGS